jgi:hypothetical protein
MGAGKNITRGTLFTALYITTTMVIPFISFTLITNLGQIGGTGVNLGLAPEKYTQIIFWVMAFGVLVCGSAFFAYSSPKQSVRRGVFALVQIVMNCLYIWSYKFSGATEIELALVDNTGAAIGEVGLDFQQLIMIYLGIYFLTIVLKTFDLVDFIVNRETIKEMRIKGTLEKRKERIKKQEKEEGARK